MSCVPLLELTKIKRQYIQHVLDWDRRTLDPLCPAFDPLQEYRWTADELAWDKPESLQKVLDILKKRTQISGMNGNSCQMFGPVNGYTTPVHCSSSILTSRFVNMEESVLAGAEQELLSWLRELTGFSAPCVGAMCSGSSSALIIGLHEARLYLNISNNDVTKSVVYITNESHGSVRKGLKAAGLDGCIIRFVSLNKQFVMDTDHFQELVERDYKDGLRPAIVVATFGYTKMSTADDVNKIAELAQQYNLWCHIDGAVGGFCLLDPQTNNRYRNGFQKAHSLNVSLHKSTLDYVPSGMVLVQKRYAYPQHIWRPTIVHGVPQRDTATVDILNTPLEKIHTQLLRAYPIWLSWKMISSDELIPKIVEKTMLMKEYARNAFETHTHFKVLVNSLRNVAFVCRARNLQAANKNTALLVDAIKEHHPAFVAVNYAKGVTFISICLGNPFTTIELLQALLERIRVQYGAILDQTLPPLVGPIDIEKQITTLDKHFMEFRTRTNTIMPLIIDLSMGQNSKYEHGDYLELQEVADTSREYACEGLPTLLSDIGVMSCALTTYVGGAHSFPNGGALLDKHMLRVLALAVGHDPSSVGGGFYDDMVMCLISALVCAKTQMNNGRRTFTQSASPVLYVVGEQREELTRAVAVALLDPPTIRVYSRLQASQPDFQDTLRDQIAADTKQACLMPMALVVDLDSTLTSPGYYKINGNNALDCVSNIMQAKKTFGIWTHLTIQNRGQHLLLGETPSAGDCSPFDSVSINLQHHVTHPKPVAAILVRDGNVLRDCVMLENELLGNYYPVDHPNTLPATGEDISLNNYVFDLTRPARSLPLWMVFKVLGSEEVSKHL